MKLIVIRHGQSEGDILDVFEGRADFELTPTGKIQAEKLSLFISSAYKIDMIYSSPLKRAKQTAEILNFKCRTSLTVLDNLMEFNNGLLAGLPKDEANIKYPKIPNLPYDKAMYEMESMKELRFRADKVLNKIISSSSDSDIIAIVSHGGLISKLYHSFMNLPIDCNISYPTADTAYHIWEINGSHHTIVSSNNCNHLNL